MIAEALNVGLTSSALLTFSVGFALHERFMRVGEVRPTRVFGAIVALMQAQLMLAGLLTHSPLAYISAAGTAAALYVWWSNGGGGGTSRAFRKIKKRLTVVRPVPQGV